MNGTPSRGVVHNSFRMAIVIKAQIDGLLIDQLETLGEALLDFVDLSDLQT